MQRALLAFGAMLLAGTSATAAQGLGKCALGQTVIDRSGESGVIVSGGAGLCLVRYADGEVIGWTVGNLRPATGNGKSAATTNTNSHSTVITPIPQSGTSAVTVIRPTDAPHSLSVYSRGGNRFELTADVDGTPIRFLVDTGASLVTLRLADAEAIGIDRSALAFDHVLETANGRVRVAFVTLHDISINDLSVDSVVAAVGDVKVSVLGMNFLSRLKRFEINGDALTLEW